MIILMHDARLMHSLLAVLRESVLVNVIYFAFIIGKYQ